MYVLRVWFCTLHVLCVIGSWQCPAILVRQAIHFVSSRCVDICGALAAEHVFHVSADAFGRLLQNDHGERHAILYSLPSECALALAIK